MANLTGMDTSARRYFFEQYLNRCAFQNGKNQPRAYDRAAWYKLGIQHFPFVPTVAAGAAGNLIGEYAYFVVPVNSRHRNGFGQVKAGLPSVMSARITVEGLQIGLSAIPSTHPDSQVDYYFIYRCKADTLDADTSTADLDFFYVGKVAVGTTTFTDNVSDDELDDAERLRFNTNIPPCGKILVQYGERLFSGGFDPITTGTATKASKTITASARTNQIVTITATGHGYSVGDWVSITLTTPDIRLEGCVYIRSTPTADTFTYHSEGADIAAGGGGTAEKITFSGVTLPDGVLTAWFQKQGEGTVYRILGYNSTTGLALDRAFVGTLSGSTYRIFRDEGEIDFSEYKDMDAWGSEGELLRNKVTIPGKEGFRGAMPWNGQLLIFSSLNIYAIEGKGSARSDVRLSPDPVFAGYGCIGPDAIWAEGDDLYFVTTQGVYVLRPGRAPEPVGERLATDWLNSLNASEQELVCIYSNGRKVWVNYPESGNTENSKCFRYERTLDQWYPELGPYARFGFRYDGDGGIQGQAFYAVGRDIWQPDYGTVDGPAAYSGPITSSTSTSATNSAAAFSTSDGGLENCIVRFFRTSAAGVETYLGARRITSNSGTSVSWSASGAGGGSLSLNTATDRYEIGNIPWRWTTKTFEQSAHESKLRRFVVGVNAIDAAKYIRMQKYVNGSAAGNKEKLMCAKLTQAFDLQDSVDSYAVEISSRDGVVLRTATVVGTAKAKNQ